jgi:hypothetical protein
MKPLIIIDADILACNLIVEVGLPKNKKWDGITKKQLKYKIFR